ncbi:MAG: hypothetical protein LBI10_12675 [Deltaproteobacteria bacterium]|nr:hypothetical protein [Deltaproteobacteria bacterium]
MGTANPEISPCPDRGEPRLKAHNRRLGFSGFLALALFPFLDNYAIFFLSFYLVGVAGTLGRLYFAIKSYLTSSDHITLLAACLERDSLCAALILAFFLAFLHSIVWPNGQINLFLNYGLDYYSWIFAAEYLVGGLNPNSLDLTPRFLDIIRSHETFGTFILIDYIAAAHLKTPLQAASTIGLTLLVWVVAAIYNLARQVFDLKPWLTLLLTMSLAASGLFNYLVIAGMLGHLTAMFRFLIALVELCQLNNYESSEKAKLKRLFFPLFFLLLAYQACYIFYASFLALFGALIATFCHPKHRSWLIWLAKAAFKGAGPIILVTIFGGLLSPGIMGYLVQRSFEVAAQTTGWALPFFSPWHFSGWPYYAFEAFKVGSPLVKPTDLLAYAPLVAVTLILLLVLRAIERRKPRPLTTPDQISQAQSQLGVIAALSVTFLIALISYLALVLKFGHYYKIWKFAVYIILPLSFIPLALYFKSLSRLTTLKPPIFLSLAVVALVLGLKFADLPNLKSFPYRYYNLISGDKFLAGLIDLRARLPKSAVTVINFDTYDDIWMSSMVFGSQKTNKTLLIPSLPFIKYNHIYLDNINEDLFMISDTKYDNLLLDRPNILYSDIIYVYDYKKILERGLASFWIGPNPYYMAS